MLYLAVVLNGDFHEWLDVLMQIFSLGSVIEPQMAAAGGRRWGVHAHVWDEDC